jgi:flagellar motor switch protein FliN
MVALNFDYEEFKNLAGPAVSSFAQAIGELTMKQAQADISDIKASTFKDAIQGLDSPHTSLAVQFESGIKGGISVLIDTMNACMISNVLMGMDPTEELATTLSEMQQSALSEVINQAVSAMVTTLSNQLGTPSSLTPVVPQQITADTRVNEIFRDSQSDEVAVASIDFSLEGVMSGKIYQLFSQESVLSMLPASAGTGQAETPAVPSQPLAVPEAQPQTVPAQAGPPPTIQPVSFGQLSSNAAGDSGNLGMLMDVNLKVTVELGRTRLSIKDILELSQGSVVELEKLAGEPVDLLINNKLFAKGEVIVIDENFGVRVTEIISQVARVDALR